ncbi:MAG: hypothetical protein K940chlam6_01465 [Chlamydiae bacterium]|nr:hypothetical protein [Chlamydiota bacterium]
MVEAIEPITPKKMKKIYQPFLVVPPPLIPQWIGAILPYQFFKIIFNSSSRVIEATLENFQWEKKKRDEQVKQERLRSLIRGLQKKSEYINFSNRRVAIIQAA